MDRCFVKTGAAPLCYLSCCEVVKLYPTAYSSVLNKHDEAVWKTDTGNGTEDKEHGYTHTARTGPSVQPDSALEGPQLLPKTQYGGRNACL